jgi:hypothetical protein
MKEFGQLIQVWDLIKEGSVTCELSQGNDLFGMHFNSDTVIIDIKHPSAMDMISPFIKKNLELRAHTMDHVRDRGSILLGILGAFRAKRTELTKYLSIIQEVASVLAENKKCVILAENGRQLAKLGYGADSMGMRLLNLKHIEVNDLSALLRLLERAKFG